MVQDKIFLIKNCFFYLSQPLQKNKVACFGMPSVISTWALKQATHILEGLASIGTAHWQHNLKKTIKEFYINNTFLSYFVIS